MLIGTQEPVSIQQGLLGRPHSLEHYLLYQMAINPGDAFVDVGANAGEFTMLASALVGPHGVVHAFEPNPEECHRIQKQIEANSCQNIVLHRVALGSAERNDQLVVPTDRSIFGSLATSGPHAEGTANRFNVQVRKGDAELSRTINKPTFVKIDCEGHEFEVLLGMNSFIRQTRPVLFVEMDEIMLRHHGADYNNLFGYFKNLKYQAYAVEIKRNLLRPKSFRLRHVEDARALRLLQQHARCKNVCWIDWSNSNADRLKQAAGKS